MGQDVSGPTQPAQVVSAFRKNTPFSQVEAEQILHRYTCMDPSSHGQVGISVDDCTRIPELTGCVFAPDLVRFYKDPGTRRIHAKQFMKICTMLSRRTPALKKKELLFDMYDVDRQKILSHDAMFRMYKLLFHSALSDDHILALVFSALRHPNLLREGEVSRDEFCEMIPDAELQEKLTVDFAFDPLLDSDTPEVQSEYIDSDIVAV